MQPPHVPLRRLTTPVRLEEISPSRLSRHVCVHRAEGKRRALLRIVDVGAGDCSAGSPLLSPPSTGARGAVAGSGVRAFALTIAIALSTSACDLRREFLDLFELRACEQLALLLQLLAHRDVGGELDPLRGLPDDVRPHERLDGRVNPTSPEVRAQSGLIVDVAAEDAISCAHLDGLPVRRAPRRPEPGVRGVPLGCGGGGFLIGGSCSFPA